MTYRYRKLEKLQSHEMLYRGCSCCSEPLVQFEILDSNDKRVCVVFAEEGAQSVISIMNSIGPVEEKEVNETTKFALWTEGFGEPGSKSAKPIYHGDIEGKDFFNAVSKYVSTLPVNEASYWWNRDGLWYRDHLRAFDSEDAANRMYK